MNGPQQDAGARDAGEGMRVAERGPIMGFYNFAGQGYTALRPLLAGEYWDLSGNARLTFNIREPSARSATMNFTRPRTDADRAQTLMGVSLDGPDEGQSLSGRGAFVVALLNFFNVAMGLANPQPVARDVNVVGLGYDDGHAGSRERHYETFDEAVSERGLDWVRSYKERLRWGGFFTERPGWNTRGALASQYDVMILRLDDTLAQLEIAGFYNDRRANLCRMVVGHAVRRDPELRPAR